jgi:DNA-directed RNA polymerase
VWGYDKDSLEGRYQWLLEHEELVLQVARDPMGFDWWTEADKPWQFLAFCFEWHGYKTEGLDYETRLPCAYDGSCNGIQHFSAALRDEVGAKAVNVLPSEKPNDIYGVVAGVARERLLALVNSDADTARRAEAGVAGASEGGDGVASPVEGEVHTESSLADMLLRVGIDRKVTKRPVMIVPYNGTKNAVRGYLIEALVDKDADEVVGAAMFKAVTLLTNVVWDAIGEVVVAARGAMDWIADATMVVMREVKPPHLEWTTPMGFVVRQTYNEFDAIRVQTMIREYKIRARINYAEASDRASPRKHKQSTSPNWVHSMDAAMLMDTVNRCTEYGITEFAMVHDSYGVKAPDAVVLNRELRESFVDMYRDSPLVALRDEWELRYGVVLPPLPPTGNLNLEEVRDSDYFFA